MFIQMLFNSPTRLADSSIRYERYLDGFRRLGHEAGLATTVASASGVDWASTVPDSRSLSDPSLWSRPGPDVVFLPTWLGMSSLLAAIRPHARHVVGLADSDGYVGPRVHPRQTLSRMLAGQRSPGGKLRSAGWWGRQYLGVDRSVDREALESCRLCDRVVVSNPGAGLNLQAFLRSEGRDDLASRVVVAPYPVAESFESAPVTGDREALILAAGRWDDPQKAAGLLAGTIGELIRRRADSRVIVIGAGGEGWFGPIARAHPGRVEYRGVVPQSEVLELLGSSRVLLSTSLWESGPIVAAEAVLRGCSVVGPASIPGFRQLADAGCGRVFAGRRPGAVADAVEEEVGAWRDGQRDPQAIAAGWRGYFMALEVCERILRGLDPSRPGLAGLATFASRGSRRGPEIPPGPFSSSFTAAVH